MRQSLKAHPICISRRDLPAVLSYVLSDLPKGTLSAGIAAQLDQLPLLLLKDSELVYGVSNSGLRGIAPLRTAPCAERLWLCNTQESEGIAALAASFQQLYAVEASNGSFSRSLERLMAVGAVTNVKVRTPALVNFQPGSATEAYVEASWYAEVYEAVAPTVAGARCI